jgi:hypothetical protein
MTTALLIQYTSHSREWHQYSTYGKRNSVMQQLHQIIVQGHLDPDWSEWFERLTITHLSNGTTLLSGPLADQAVLYGVLLKVRDLGLPLLSFTCIDPEEAPADKAQFT